MAAKKRSSLTEKSMRLRATLFCFSQDTVEYFPIYQYTALIVTGVYNIPGSEVKYFRAVLTLKLRFYISLALT